MKFSIKQILLGLAVALVEVQGSLSSDERDELLSLHKKARSAVNSSNMKSISWSSDLESKAQSYANQCNGMKHSGGNPENLASFSKRNVSYLFNLWEDERSLFNSVGYRSKFKGSMVSTNKGMRYVGHYSQVVWADNTKVGCGMSFCKNDKQYLLVCRYGTINSNQLKNQIMFSGNIIGQEVYKLGGSSHDDDDDEKKTTTRKETTTARKTTTTTSTSNKTTSPGAKPTNTETKATSTAPTTSSPTSSNDNHDEVTVVIDDNPLNVNGTMTNGNYTDVGGVFNRPDTIVITVGHNTDSENVENDDEISKEQGSGTIIKNKDGSIAKLADPVETDGTTGVYVTGITFGVMGAAAASLVLLKKRNPDQYKKMADNVRDISRSISRRATSVKRGATMVTRRLTTRRSGDKVGRSTKSKKTIDTESYRQQFLSNLSKEEASSFIDMAPLSNTVDEAEATTHFINRVD